MTELVPSPEEVAARQGTRVFLLAAAVPTLLAGAMAADPAQLLRAGFNPEKLASAIAFAARDSAASGLLWGTLAWVALYFSVVRRRKPKAGPAHYVILIAIAMLGHMIVELTPVLGALAHDRRQDELARQGVIDTVRQAGSGAAAVDPRPKAQGDAGVMEGFIKANVNKSLALRRAYLAELATAGFPTLLAEENLRADTNLAHSEAVLRDSADIVAKYRKATFAQQAQSFADVASLPITEGNRATLLAGMKAGADQGEADARLQWSLEARMVDAHADALKVLKSALGHWSFADGKLAFERPRDLQDFQARLADIRDIAARQASLQRQMSIRAEQQAAKPLGR